MAGASDVAAGRVARELFPQADLLGLPVTPAMVATATAAGRKAGRPPGSRNRRDEDIARLLLERFGDPLAHQVAVATMGVDELAAALGCSRIEALAEKRLAAQVVMPYLHSRKPLAVDVTNHKAISLTINTGAAAPAPVGQQDDAARTVEVVEYQEVQMVDDDTL